MLTRQDLCIGLHVYVGYSGSKRFSGDRWGCGDFNGHIEAFGVDWVAIRDSSGESRVASNRDFSELEISEYDEEDDDE